MFNFIFGLVWTLFTSFIFFVFYKSSGDIITMMTKETFVFYFLVFFELIGLVLLISGLRKIIKDRKTEKYGFKCYGIVRDIVPTGSYVNDRPEYKVVVDVANTKTLQIEEVSEIIGFDYNKYPVDSYVLCKYYEGDINIVGIALENEVPSEVKESISPIN